MTQGAIYLQTARELPSDAEVNDALMMEDAKAQGALAKKIAASNQLHAGSSVGPGAGPGIRLQSPGLPCPNCSHLSSVRSRHLVVRNAYRVLCVRLRLKLRRP